MIDDGGAAAKAVIKMSASTAVQSGGGSGSEGRAAGLVPGLSHTDGADAVAGPRATLTGCRCHGSSDRFTLVSPHGQVCERAGAGGSTLSDWVRLSGLTRGALGTGQHPQRHALAPCWAER